MPALPFLDEKMKHYPYRARLMNGYVTYVGKFMGPDLNSASDLVYARIFWVIDPSNSVYAVSLGYID